MTFDEIERVRHALHLWRTTKAVGPRKSRAFTDLFDLLLATGCRIGEACALRWQDIDLHAGTLTVAGTMVFLKNAGWERQALPKTLAGQRTIHLRRSPSPCSADANSRNPITRTDPFSPAAPAPSSSRTTCAGHYAVPCNVRLI